MPSMKATGRHGDISSLELRHMLREQTGIHWQAPWKAEQPRTRSRPHSSIKEQWHRDAHIEGQMSRQENMEGQYRNTQKAGMRRPCLSTRHNKKPKLALGRCWGEENLQQDKKNGKGGSESELGKSAVFFSEKGNAVAGCHACACWDQKATKNPRPQCHVTTTKRHTRHRQGKATNPSSPCTFFACGRIKKEEGRGRKCSGKNKGVGRKGLALGR